MPRLAPVINTVSIEKTPEDGRRIASINDLLVTRAVHESGKTDQDSARPHRHAAAMTKRTPPLDNLEAEALSAAQAKAALTFIEARLFEPLSVKTIAQACGVSPFRFSRQFTQRQGESVMAYVRGRRLEAAMRRLLVDGDVAIVDLAFDCGFDSQEAFTRAFRRAFGETPGRFRRSHAPVPLHRRRRKMMNEIVIHESIETRPALKFAGLAAHFTPANLVDMPELWKRLVPHIGFESQIGERETYGIWRSRNPADGSFDFLAAVRIEPESTPPPALEVLALPARTYLVYKQMLVDGELHPQMIAATDEIFMRRVPRSGRTLAHGPDFQFYPADFKWVGHYLPVEA